MGHYDEGDQVLLLWVLFMQAYSSTAKVREIALKELGLTFNHTLVLVSVMELGKDATPAKISRRILRKPHTISELIDRMVDMDLIKKLPNARRRRGVVVELTEKGEEKYVKMHEMKAIRRLLGSLPSKQQEYLRSAFRLIRDNALNELSELKDTWQPPHFTDPQR